VFNLLKRFIFYLAKSESFVSMAALKVWGAKSMAQQAILKIIATAVSSLVFASGSVLAQSSSAPAAQQTKKSSAASSGATQPKSSTPSKTASANAAKKQASNSGQKAAAKSSGQAQKRQVSAKKADPKAAERRKSFAKNERGYNSLGTRLGLRSQLSEINLNSSAVLVVDQTTGEVLLDKNADIALPIASITKVMTALVVLDADLPLSEVIPIVKEDSELEKYSSSRLRVGSRFTRAELLHLALMSSENRAAHALGRTYPGGMEAFVKAMNDKADELGMTNSSFSEPTGLSSKNMSTPRDLSRLVNAAYEVPLIREYSTATSAIVKVGGQQQQFRNTNALTRNNEWEIGLSKTGFIRDAGKCLVMQATVDQQDVIIVMLDAQGSASRLSDAERIRRWLSADKDRQVAVSSARS
jgi:D-alanyl-D-alanine endopeptidase (penicillin-binding protein 7)